MSPHVLGVAVNSNLLKNMANTLLLERIISHWKNENLKLDLYVTFSFYKTI
jgi:hypothetical protein